MITVDLSLLSNAVLAKLRESTLPDDTPIPVGDMVIPEHSGWMGSVNMPGSLFRPYGILVPQPASQFAGSIGDPTGDPRAPYVVQVYGATREQSQFVGDLLRRKLPELREQVLTLGTADYKVIQVEMNALGAPVRVPGTDPAYYGQQDQITIWLSKRR